MEITPELHLTVLGDHVLVVHLCLPHQSQRAITA